MTRNPKMSTVVLSTLLALMAIVFMTVGASAAPSHGLAVSHVHSNAVPTVKITGNPANYKPGKIKVHVSTTLSFNIINTETVAESVTYMGSVLVTIPPGATQGIICNRPNKATFSLTSNTKAKLAINCVK